MLNRQIDTAVFLFAAIIVCQACGSNVSTSDNFKYKEIEAVWKTVPIYSGFDEIETETTSVTAGAEIIRKYRSTANFADADRFYHDELPVLGWEQIDERNVKDRGRLRGERILVFQKEDYWLTIQFAGNRRSELGWDYAVRLASPKGWSDRVF